MDKDKSEWIGIPNPDAVCLNPLTKLQDHPWYRQAFLQGGNQFWELSGRIFRCGCCAHSMATHASYSKKGGEKKRYHYYHHHYYHC